jgi:hypothetical protein
VISAQKVHCPHGVKEVAASSWAVNPAGCAAEVKLEELPHHLSAVCIYTVVPCAMAEHGCKWQSSRHALPMHAIECMFEKMRGVLESKSAELAACRTELAEKKKT